LISFAEHWYLRLPIPAEEAWTLSLTGERQIPPLGAVSYLFRLHRNTPVLRLDLDRTFWDAKLKGNPKAEASLFGDLDYCSHDQRACGYPYPIKACHDRARLSNAERNALKKQIIDAAVAAGMKRSLFRDVSAATGQPRPRGKRRRHRAWTTRRSRASASPRLACTSL